ASHPTRPTQAGATRERASPSPPSGPAPSAAASPAAATARRGSGGRSTTRSSLRTAPPRSSPAATPPTSRPDGRAGARPGPRAARSFLLPRLREIPAADGERDEPGAHTREHPVAREERDEERRERHRQHERPRRLRRTLVDLLDIAIEPRGPDRLVPLRQRELGAREPPPVLDAVLDVPVRVGRVHDRDRREVVVGRRRG